MTKVGDTTFEHVKSETAPDLSVPDVEGTEGDHVVVLHKYNRHWPDIEKTVEFTVRNYEMSFRAWNCIEIVVGENGKPNRNAIAYEVDSNYFPDFCEDREKADVLLHGFIKWDGCSNWWFDCAEDVAEHFCDRKGIENFGTLMLRIHDQAKAIPQWDGE